MADLTPAQAYDVAFQLHQAGRAAEAEALCRKILAAEPQHAATLHLLGVIAFQFGHDAAAVALMQQAIAAQPAVADYHNNLSLVLERLGQVAAAVASVRRALQLKPDYPAALNNLGNFLTRLEHTDEAVAAFQDALRLAPAYADALSNLGVALKDRGDLDGAIAAFRRALQLRPDFAKAHSHLIFTLHYHAGTDAALLARELRAFRERFGAPLRAARQPHARARDRGKRLRVGYVSPDLRQHAVGRFLLPLLAHHDAAQVEVCCYSDVVHPDTLTAQLRAHAHLWRDTAALDDEALAAQIRADGIDILVDLALHTGRNRLLVFARKPAPVQVTYLAYCGSSGLDAMDYRLTDPWFDPAQSDQPAHSERSITLPSTYWCYRPPADCPEVNALPAASDAPVTFGSLNNFCKMTPPTLAAWARVLVAVPDSRLVLRAPAGSHRAQTLERLAAVGVTASRVQFVDRLPLSSYFEAYHQCDLALDPFPYGGGTTTCDALWMGVPVVTLAGALPITRAGSSILHNLGLPELVATSEGDYVERVVALARDLPRLAELRRTLRARMQASPLMDEPRFARDVETAYRQMWRRWCEAPAAQ